jgi:hypothetical protein
MSDTEEMIDAMLDAGEELPDEVRQGLVEADGVTDRLIEIVQDEQLGRLDARGEGWGPIHAARILAARGDSEAIAPLIGVLEGAEIDDYLTDAVAESLGAFGGEPFDELLERAGAVDADEVELRARLLGAAIETGQKSDALYAEIESLFEEDAEWGAMLFADYGDEEALDLLNEALDDASIKSETRMFANVDLIEIADAIEELGGSFSSKQRRKVAYAKKRQRKAGAKLQRRLKRQ